MLASLYLLRTLDSQLPKLRYLNAGERNVAAFWEWCKLKTAQYVSFSARYPPASEQRTYPYKSRIVSREVKPFFCEAQGGGTVRLVVSPYNSDS